MAWYAVHVRTGREDAVCRAISKQAKLVDYRVEYELLVPKRKLQERHQGEFVEVIRTMFPGYVLVQTKDIREFANAVVQSKGVFRFLQNEDVFQEVNPAEIYFVLQLINVNGEIEPSEVALENGMARLLNGPLKGYEGLIKQIDKHHRRAKVSLTFDGKEYLINLAVNVQSSQTD
jgi:transcriptional antiterminator NusG